MYVGVGGGVGVAVGVGVDVGEGVAVGARVGTAVGVGDGAEVAASVGVEAETGVAVGGSVGMAVGVGAVPCVGFAGLGVGVGVITAVGSAAQAMSRTARSNPAVNHRWLRRPANANAFRNMFTLWLPAHQSALCSSQVGQEAVGPVDDAVDEDARSYNRF